MQFLHGGCDRSTFFLQDFAFPCVHPLLLLGRGAWAVVRVASATAGFPVSMLMALVAVDFVGSEGAEASVVVPP